MKHISPQKIDFPLNNLDATPDQYSYWIQKNHYYHARVQQFYVNMIPQGMRVLHINAKNGYILNALHPLEGVGVERGAAYHKDGITFYDDLDHVPTASFDYILLSFTTMETDDIHTLLMSLHRFCHPHTRIILETYTSLWAPVLWATKKLQLRRPTEFKNWVSRRSMMHFVSLAHFDVVTHGGHTLMPAYVPLVSNILNNLVAYAPLINRACLHQWMVLRPVIAQAKSNITVSVIIPCRNEEGNIEDAVKRCPQMGAHTEIIFVEGNSKDNTLAEVQRVAQKYSDRDIKWFVQPGKGKGDAVRTGFKHARGDILMIQDADLTAPPEELPKFFDAMVSGKGECINGSRLVYGMESEAMTFLSWVANNFFGYMVSWIIGQPISDTLCGTKVLWRKDWEQILVERVKLGLYDPFGDFDVLFGAAKLHLKIVDVPVHYKNRTYGTTNISRFKEVWFLLFMCYRALRVIRMK